MADQPDNCLAGMPEASAGGSGRNPRGTAAGASSVPTRKENPRWEEKGLMEAVVERENMMAAYKRVVGNKGAAGVDGMSVDELKPYLDDQWVRIKAELLEGRYEPQAVAQVEILNVGKPQPKGTWDVSISFVSWWSKEPYHEPLFVELPWALSYLRIVTENRFRVFWTVTTG